MPDYSDLAIRYIDGEAMAVLVFNAGKSQLLINVDALQNQHRLTSAGDLVAALKEPGVYTLAAGSYLGNFTASAPGVVLNCEDGVTLTPKEPSLQTLQVNGSGFAMSGGHIDGAVNDIGTVIVGSNSATSADQQPDGVMFTGTTVAAVAGGAKRGFALHGKNITLDRVSATNYWRAGQEVQALWVNNGPGPYTFTGCRFEGAGENFLCGGDNIKIPGCIPSDLTFRDCTFFKPQEWRTNGASVKNLFELKNAQRVLVENCIFDGCWKSSQAGHAIVFTPRNTAAAAGLPSTPWVTVDQVVFRHNIIRNSKDGYGVNILGHDDGGRESGQVKSIVIEDNLFQHCTNGVQVGSGVTENLTINRNTFPATTGTILLFGDKTTKTALTMNQNAGKAGAYAVILSGAAKGLPSLDAACSAYQMTGNILEKLTSSIPLPAGNALLVPGALVLDADFVLPGGQAGWSGPSHA